MAFKRRPFHETIVDVIRDHRLGDEGGMVVILRLLGETKIPKGHYEILAALKEKIPSINLDEPPDPQMGDPLWTGVARDILEQKQEVEAEARRKKESEEMLVREDALER